MRSKKFRSTLITFGIVIAAFIACQVMISTGAMTRSLKGQLVPICAYVVMAVSLNLTVGISGELSLGHAGFMSALPAAGDSDRRRGGRYRGRGHRYSGAAPARRLSGDRHAGVW